MAPFLLLCSVFLRVTLTDGLKWTVFTLYTEPMGNWQTAVTFCRERGRELMRVTSRAENNFLSSLGRQHGAWFKENLEPVWTSLHNPDQATAGEGYRWQLLDPAECQTLGSWTNDWVPSDAEGKWCVAAVWDEVSSRFRWHNEDCDMVLKKIVCRRVEGACEQYEEFRGYVITAMSVQKIVHVPEVLTERDCRAACTAVESTETEGCLAAEITRAVGCILHIAQAPFSTADIEPWNDATLYVRRCWRGWQQTARTMSAVPTISMKPDPVATRPVTRNQSTSLKTAKPVTPITSIDTQVTTSITSNTHAGPSKPETARSTTSTTSTIPTTATDPETTTSTISTTSASPTTSTTPNKSTTPTISATSITSVNPRTSTSTTFITSMNPVKSTSTTSATSMGSQTTTSMTTATFDTPSTPSTTLTPFTSLSTAVASRTATTSSGSKESTESVSSEETISPTDTPGPSFARTRLCPCACCRSALPLNITAEQVKTLSEHVKKTLSVDHQNTSSFKRKFISASDPRPSAQTIGWLGWVVLVAVVVFVVATDVCTAGWSCPHRVGPAQDTLKDSA